MIDQALHNSVERLEITFYSSGGTIIVPATLTINIDRITKDGMTSIITGAPTNIGPNPNWYLLTASGVTSVLGQYQADWNLTISGGDTYQVAQYFEVVRNKTRYAPVRAVLENFPGWMHEPLDLDESVYIRRAENLIDNELAGLYTVPMTDQMIDPTILDQTKETIEAITADLASGNMLMGLAFGREDDRTNAYAKELIDRATRMLQKIKDGKVPLTGILYDPSPTGENVLLKPIHNAPDPISKRGWFDTARDIPNKYDSGGQDLDV